MARKRRGFGRIRRERSGRYSAAYIGPDAKLHHAPGLMLPSRTLKAGSLMSGARSTWERGALSSARTASHYVRTPTSGLGSASCGHALGSTTSRCWGG